MVWSKTMRGNRHETGRWAVTEPDPMQAPPPEQEMPGGEMHEVEAPVEQEEMPTGSMEVEG